MPQETTRAINLALDAILTDPDGRYQNVRWVEFDTLPDASIMLPYELAAARPPHNTGVPWISTYGADQYCQMRLLCREDRELPEAPDEPDPPAPDDNEKPLDLGGGILGGGSLVGFALLLGTGALLWAALRNR
jgi:hypothetical protein